MSRMLLSVSLFVLIAGAAVPASVGASTISGTFDISGNFTASNTTTWTSSTAVADQATIPSNGLLGSFVGLGNSLVTIKDLNIAVEPVGVLFLAQDFINFLSPLAASFPQLDVNFIPQGVGGSAGCLIATPAPGQTCTPTAPGGSPFTFLNETVGSSIGSAVTFDLSGVTSDGQSQWSAIFTSQSNEPFQTVLAGAAANGSFGGSYSATITVTAISPVPEPRPVELVFMGLLFLAAVGVRLHRRQVATAGQ